jgi:hypothetical protein
MAPAADRGNHHCMAMTIKQLRVASDDDLIEAHDEVASYHRLGGARRRPGDGGGAMAVTGISRSRH